MARKTSARPDSTASSTVSTVCADRAGVGLDQLDQAGDAEIEALGPGADIGADQGQAAEPVAQARHALG